MHSVLQDLRFGLRSLRKQPSFTILALLALGLGVGAATTIFSVIQNVLLDPFPYTDAQHVYQFWIHDNHSSRPGGRTMYSLPEFLDYQEQVRSFAEVIGSGGEDILLSTKEGTLQYRGGYVTENSFRSLGVPPLLGRVLTPEDSKPGAPPVFVMGYDMWAKFCSGDPGVLGKTFILNGTPTTLVGVMPSRFHKMGADLYRLAKMDRADAEWNDRYFVLQARLKPGVTPEQARAEFETVAHRLATVYPRNYPENFSVEVQSWLDSVIGPFKKTLYRLAGAVGLLLLIACANVANLLLARATSREKEMAVRSALGATRGRLVRQLLIESLVLAMGGMVTGVAFSFIGIKGLVAMIPPGLIPRESVIHMNFRVLLFSLGVAAVTALIFGLLPALETTRTELVESMKDSGKGITGGFRRGWLRNSLVVAEVALSMALLVGAGLVMRSFMALTQQDLGVDVDHILLARLPFQPGQYETAQQKQNFFRQLLPRLQGLPGVVAATETSSVPPFGGINSSFQIAGKVHEEHWYTTFQLCSEGYFPTVGLKLRSGRVFTEAEVADARRVAVINQTLATKYFGQEDPIGRQIKLDLLEDRRGGGLADAWFEVIGVTSDAKNRGLQEPTGPEMFVPYSVTGAFSRGVLVRTSGDPAVVLADVRREIWAVDRDAALSSTGRLKDLIREISYGEPRFSVILFGVFACVGILLVALGVYSVIAYKVSLQTHEIGIRMALGATNWNVLGMVLWRGGQLIALGIVAGMTGGIVVGKVLSSQLFGISEHDPITLMGVTAMVAAIGMMSCYLPARRATRVDPMVALRHD